MRTEPLFEIDTRFEVENRVDAMFAPLYSLVAESHHEAIKRVEQDMINALKAAMRLPATEPVPPDPMTWPFGSGKRLSIFLSRERRAKLRDTWEK